MNKKYYNDVELVNITPHAMDLLKRIAGVCYQKGAVGDKVIQHILECGHWSVFEHCYATFEIHMSVAALLQMTRHRHLSFTVQSSRNTELKDLRMTGVSWIDAHIVDAYDAYEKLLDETDAETAMSALPKAAMYDVYVTGNLRAWLEYLPKRLCQRAMKEHREIAERIAILLHGNLPEIFSGEYIRPNCKTCKEYGCKMKTEFWKRELKGVRK